MDNSAFGKSYNMSQSFINMDHDASLRADKNANLSYKTINDNDGVEKDNSICKRSNKSLSSDQQVTKKEKEIS
eukprot:CAMPEP_0116918456 /NCGR_PEP_ID=MMETSP0467-20121206/19787_1 /TAXON_ID=283647 /ORGANISM="Mesodinium pulex, Strain SPMC105" /LENGTH=72 /DNA_ID=CAMNT_0004595819 /DNA_START=756 /DNA_END=974 /DNA_ORIENTATION=+